MLRAFNRRGRDALIMNIAAAVGAALALNGLVFALGWNRSSNDRHKPGSLAPPGYVVGGIWIVLYGLMATARWMMNGRRGRGPREARRWVTGLIGYGLLYPFYALAPDSPLGNLAGTLGAFPLSVISTIKLFAVSDKAGLLLMPVNAWLTYASAIVFQDLGWI